MGIRGREEATRKRREDNGVAVEKGWKRRGEGGGKGRRDEVVKGRGQRKGEEDRSEKRNEEGRGQQREEET